MRVTIVGASIAGLCSALAFRRDGWDVTVLEADAEREPDTHDGSVTWLRRGTPHARQAHAFIGGFLRAVSDLDPGLIDALMASGALSRRAADLMPPPMTDRTPRPGDEEIRILGSRRPHVEWHLRNRTVRLPGIDWRFGAHVHGLRVNGATPPRVTGVQLDGGEHIAADLIVDASGRRSRAFAWLSDAGVRLPPEIAAPCNMIYNTRYYRLHDTSEEMKFAGGNVLVAAYPTFVVLVFPGDNGFMQLAMGRLPGDPTLDPVRDERAFHAVAMLSPPIAEWIHPDRATPVSDVAAYGGLHNRLRRLVAGGEPVVLGFHFVGDAGAITNPQYGRGVSHAAIHARAVAEIASRIDDPREQTLAVDAEVRRMIEPSVHDSIAIDERRSAIWKALVEGRDPPPTAPPLPEGLTLGHQMAAEATDPTVWRAIMRCNLLLEPPGSWRSDPAVIERIRAVQPIDVPAPTADAARETGKRVEEAIAAATGGS